MARSEPRRMARPGRTGARVLVMIGALLALGAANASAATLTVKTTADETVTGDGPSSVSLREAILSINNQADTGADVTANRVGVYGTNDNIQFQIAGPGVHTITLNSTPLPALTKPVLVNGAGQPGFMGTPLIALDGTSAGSSAIGLDAQAPVLITGLAIEHFGGVGIQFDNTPTSSAGSQIQGNLIGTDATGGTAAANGGGVLVNAQNVTITNNVISGNGSSGGVQLNANNATVQGNMIGTNAAGNGAVANGGVGVGITGANNTVGGSSSSNRNIISGNTGDAVFINGSGANNNLIQGNYIGTDVSGNNALGNGGRGVHMGSGAVNNRVTDNLIANSFFDVYLDLTIPNVYERNSSLNNGSDVLVPSNPLTGALQITADGKLIANVSGGQPNEKVHIETYKSPVRCETRQLLDFFDVTLDANGRASITYTPNQPVTTGDHPSVLLTGNAEGTSSTICGQPVQSPNPNRTTIPSGFDLFATDPAQTQFNFGGELAIPAGFFGTGSAPFSGMVNFGGVPIGTFGGLNVGDTDTVVHRLGPASLVTPFPGTATVPIELVKLSLVSMQPIEVNTGTTKSFFDVFVDLSPEASSTGQITITQTDPLGGTFSSQLTVVPRFTFTNLSTGKTTVLDPGKLPPTAQSQFAPDLTLKSSGTPWRLGCALPALSVPGLNDDFCPGLTIPKFKQANIEQALRAKHAVEPPQPQPEHYKCYTVKAQAKFKSQSVQLTDQFGSRQATVTKPRTLCAPVAKNGVKVQNQVSHLKCYSIATTGAVNHVVAVRNQFGPLVLTVKKPTSLCVPSLKTPATKKGTTPITQTQPSLTNAPLTDHFECYSVSSQGPLGTTGSRKLNQRVARRLAGLFGLAHVNLLDQFGAETVRVLKPVSLCAPVQKNVQALQSITRINHPVQHLVCYRIRDVGRKRTINQRVSVTNQFGTEQLTVRKPQTLCVPSIKLLLR